MTGTSTHSAAEIVTLALYGALQTAHTLAITMRNDFATRTALMTEQLMSNVSTIETMYDKKGIYDLALDVVDALDREDKFADPQLNTLLNEIVRIANEKFPEMSRWF